MNDSQKTAQSKPMQKAMWRYLRMKELSEAINRHIEQGDVFDEYGKELSEWTEELNQLVIEQNETIL
jgi:hypothetical protein